MGKTTLAINLAVASGLKTAVFDLDQQESAAIWADRRQTDNPHVDFLMSAVWLTDYKPRREGRLTWQSLIRRLRQARRLLQRHSPLI